MMYFGGKRIQPRSQQNKQNKKQKKTQTPIDMPDESKKKLSERGKSGVQGGNRIGKVVV